MTANFSNFSDDFFVNVDLHTTLPLPSARETVLQFFEAVQKQYPDLTDFYQREAGECVLEGDRHSGSYRWLEMETRRLSAGAFNPADAEAAYQQHLWTLDRSRFYLGVSPMDVESLDVTWGFNLDYVGNRDAIISEALLSGSRLGSLAGETGATALSFEPSFVLAVDADCALQARLAIETRNSSYQVRTGTYDEEPISVYFAVRAYPPRDRRFDLAKSFSRQTQVGEELLARVVIPNIIRPIASAIAAAQ